MIVIAVATWALLTDHYIVAILLIISAINHD